MSYLGDFNTGATVRIHFTTHVASGALVAPSSAFAAADFRIYKDGSATEKTTTNGISVTSPFDSVTGRHMIAIDTSNNTGDTGFFAAGSDYRVEINSAKTVDGVVQSGVVIGTFSILNRSVNLGANAPANWINAAAIAAAALNGKGDWAVAGAAMALTSGERDTLAGVIDARLLNAGDATDLIASIVTRIGNTNVDQAAFVAAVKAALFDTGSAANKLAVDSSGRVTIGTNADKTGYALTTAPLDAAGTRAAIGLSSANLDTQLAAIDTVVDAIKVVTDKVATAIEDDGASGWQFTTLALANAPASGGGGGSGASAADIYTYFTDGTRADAFKATGFAIAGDAMALTSGERDTLAGVIDARLLNAGDATDLIASIVTRIGNTNVDQAAFVAAVKAALFDSGSAANKLAVDSSGRITFDPAGIRSAIGLAAADLDTQLASVEATVDTEALAADLAPRLAGTAIAINSPIFSGEEGENLELIQGDDYQDSPVRIDIESEEDLTSKHFVIAARLQSNTSVKLGLRMAIQSDGDGQFALFAPTAEQTETWSSGTYEIRHRIQYATNKFKTLKRGVLTILPFDTPTPLVDVDP